LNSKFRSHQKISLQNTVNTKPIPNYKIFKLVMMPGLLNLNQIIE